MALVFLLLAFAAGAAFPIQAGLNARLATWVGGPIRASLVSFNVGTVVMLVLALATTRGLVDTSRVDQIPWWAWLGGAVGASYVVSTVAGRATARRVEPLRGGDLRPARLFGPARPFRVLYRERQLSAGRIAGVVLLGVGVALVRLF